MTPTELVTQFNELVEQVNGFFSRKTEAEGKKFLKEHCDSVLETITEMCEVLGEYPVYGAVAFLGRFTFVDCPEVRSLKTDISVETLEKIRNKKAITITGVNAQQKWLHIRDNYPLSACAILSLCFLATKSSQIKHRIHNK